VPSRLHDRAITVRLTTDAVVVDYRLDIDEFTVVFLDLPAVLDATQLARLKTPTDFYNAFQDAYAPILAGNLIADLDAQSLQFQCLRHVQRRQDDDGTPLDHLRFDFRFLAPWHITRAAPHRFRFREGNYELEDGRLRLTMAASGVLQFEKRTEPDLQLQKKAPIDFGPGDSERLRRLAATFIFSNGAHDAEPETAGESPQPGRSGLLDLLLDPERGVWVLWVLAACFGAVHALTPGHGKTLVAAYLVGEQGTIWHALLLGIVTTLTHTGAVLALAGCLLYFYPDTVPARIREVLGFVGGLLVASLGFWLLLRRLANHADHVHFGLFGHQHLHDHDHAGHHHSEIADSHAVKEQVDAQISGRKGIAGLIVLGISGGIVPCWDAIAMFGFGVSAQRLWLALQLLVAFSAGLASVLIAIGILVVQVKGFAASHWGDSKLVRALPLFSAVIVTVLGLWLCYDSIHQERSMSFTNEIAGRPA
jgi:ABC-type nickel/cobalt efflux system permease component RcnA